MRKIDFASNLEFSTDVITEVLSVIAKRGSGKTYTATKLAEGMLSVGAQTVVIDPVGNWYGLRLGSNGKPEGGMDIKILGGRHGDIPLEASAGALVAKTLIETGMSAILDLTLMTKAKQRRFVTEFSEALLEGRKLAPAAMHIFWEEAYRFMPQKMAKGSKNEMLEATEELVTMGRNFGIGGTIICQRAAQVSKTCLTQASILVAMNTIGADRKVILDWIDHKGMDKNTKETTKLSDLKKGQAFVWWPEEFGIVRVKVSKKKTYDASSTPKFGDKARAKNLKPIDLGALQESMAETIERAKSEDPRHLRKKIAELEKKVRTLGDQPLNIQQVPVPVIDEEAVRQVDEYLAQLSDTAGDMAERLHSYRSDILRVGKEFGKAIDAARHAMAAAADTYRESVAKVNEHRKRMPVVTAKQKDDFRKRWEETGVVFHTSTRKNYGQALQEAPLKKGARRMLEVLAALSPGGMTKRQVATGAKLKSTSGTFSTYWSALKTVDLIEERDGLWYITDLGFERLGEDAPRPPRGREELLDFWCDRLKGKEREILRLLAGDNRGMDKQEIGDAVGLSHTSGTFSTYLSTLTANRLAYKSNGLYFSAEELR